MLANSHCSCILSILAMQETCKIVGVYMATCPACRKSTLHAGNPPDIPCVPCTGNENDMPSILHQHWHREAYRKYCSILHQDMLWKFSTILHKDWCRINDLSCTSIGTGKCTGNCALYYIRTCHGNYDLS